MINVLDEMDKCGKKCEKFQGPSQLIDFKLCEEDCAMKFETVIEHRRRKRFDSLEDIFTAQ